MLVNILLAILIIGAIYFGNAEGQAKKQELKEKFNDPQQRKELLPFLIIGAVVVFVLMFMLFGILPILFIGFVAIVVSNIYLVFYVKNNK